MTRAQAIAAGLTVDQLRSKRFTRLLRGVYIASTVVPDLRAWALAALLCAPADAVVSHLTALALYGLTFVADERIHLSTQRPLVTKHDRIILHRRKADISRRDLDGIPVTSPERTFVDCATKISFVKLVTLGDWLVHRKLSTLDDLAHYAHSRHLDGVRRARRAVRYVSRGVESPMESLVRLMLVFARLPTPECNLDITDAAGRFIARCDLVFSTWQVVVEYDGRWHERSPEQRKRDRDRREQLEAQGWRVIVIYDTDLAHPAHIPHRVFDALRQGGYDGPRPVMSIMWHRWFGTAAQV